MAGQKHYVEVTDQNFEEEVIRSSQPVLVDFWAPWCGPCRVIGPIVEELAGEFAGQVKVGKLNVDENLEVAQRFRIRGIPTLLFFEKGQVVDQIVGLVPRGEIAARLKSLTQAAA
jgi:thioredoxin 1